MGLAGHKNGQNKQELIHKSLTANCSIRLIGQPKLG
jgi:hypothetical protein